MQEEIYIKGNHILTVGGISSGIPVGGLYKALIAITILESIPSPLLLSVLRV